MKPRISPAEYAAKHRRHLLTIQRWCREGKLVARKIGGDWEIDEEASDRSLSLKFGNKTEKELVKRNLVASL